VFYKEIMEIMENT